MTARRRAVRPAARRGSRAGAPGRPRAGRPRRRVGGRRGRLREPLGELLLRRAHAARPGAAHGRRRRGRLPRARVRDRELCGMSRRACSTRDRTALVVDRRPGGASARRSTSFDAVAAQTRPRSSQGARDARRAGPRHRAVPARASGDTVPEVAEHLDGDAARSRRPSSRAAAPTASTSAAATRRWSAGSRPTCASPRRSHDLLDAGRRGARRRRRGQLAHRGEPRAAACAKMEARRRDAHLASRWRCSSCSARAGHRRVQGRPEAGQVSASAYVLLEDGTRFDGEAVRRAPARSPARSSSTPAMSGYQESVTDPCYAGQLITFTYPHIGNYGVSRRGDGVRPHPRARGDHARRRSTARTRPAPSAAGSTGSRDCGVPAITGVDTRALVRHIRDAGAMRGGIFPARAARGRGARADRGRAADGRPRPRARGHAGEPRSSSRRRRRRPADRGDRHRHQALDRAQPARARRRRRAAPVHGDRRTSCSPRDPDAFFLANGPGDPAALGLRRRHGPRAASASGRCSGICLGHQLLCRAVGLETFKLPFGHRGANHPVKDLDDRPHRDHSPEPRLRGARPGRRAHDRRATSRCAGRPTSAPPS